MPKIHRNLSIDCLSTEKEKLKLNKQKIKRHLLIIHKQLMMSMKTQKSIIQQRKVLIVFDAMIADMKANKKLSP